MLSLVLVPLAASNTPPTPQAEDPIVACWTDPPLALVRRVVGGPLQRPSLCCLKVLHLTDKRPELHVQNLCVEEQCWGRPGSWTRLDFLLALGRVGELSGLPAAPPLAELRA